MENLLKHLIDITCQRDHELLDSAVVSAIYELINAEQVRVYELVQLRNELFMKPKIWIESGIVRLADEIDSADTNASSSLNNYPALMAGLKERKNCIEESKINGDRVLWLPVWLNDKISTCIQVTNPAPNQPNTLSVLEGIFSVYRNYQNLLDYSERDSLTGLLNRKTFDEKFSRLIAAALPESSFQQSAEERRHRQSTAKSEWLAVIDIDHFKRVNDQFGHLYGDEVLILVANVLRSSFRSHDRVFRFGGEEFVVLLRSATLDEAQKIFERLRTNIEQHTFPQVGRVTISLGFVCIRQESPVVILGHADRALYYAKANGRNRVCHYEGLLNNGEIRSEVSHDTAEFF